jgi:hypothetical protein
MLPRRIPIRCREQPLSSPSFEAGSPAALLQARAASGGAANLGPQYAVSRNGRFLVNTRVDDFVLTPLVLILNWKSAAKK